MRSIHCCLWMCLLTLANGCAKHGPSEAYAQAQRQLDRLYADKGDEAYVDPSIDDILALLRKVPASSEDAPASRELSRRIQDNRTQLQARHAKQQEDLAQILAEPDRPTTVPDKVEDVRAPEPDAGASEPYSGMTVQELSTRFSRCFESGAPVLVMNKGMRDTWRMKPVLTCRDLFPRLKDQLLLIEDGKIWGEVPLSALEHRQPDGGLLPDAGPASGG